MVKKDSVTPLQSVLTTKGFIDVCLRENVPVICINKNTQKDRTMPFSAMYGNNKEFWLQHSSWDYFFSNDDLQRLEDKLPKPAPRVEVVQSGPEGEDVAALIPVAEGEDDVQLGYGSEYEAIAEMNDVERARHIRKDKERLENLMSMKPKEGDVVTEALVETARDAIMHNHASLMSALTLPPGDAKRQTQDLVDSTRELVRASIQLISTDIFNCELMNTLVLKSNGTIIQHMTRVYLNGLSFLSYFNKQVSSSHAINRIRVAFDDKYRSFYRSLLPHIHPDHFSLERIFLGGMRAISENDLYNWATGFLIHDIGKATAVEYHEGEAAYNRDIVTEHVRIGFANIVGKTNYPQEAALITGYHHEYYGDPGGYGIFRSYFDQYKSSNSFVKQNYCISYDLPSVLDYKVLAYFPAKVLEIIDVFDSVTDPQRKYRRAMSTENALAMMRDEFILKHPKLDLILFDIFSSFATEALSVWNPSEANSIIQESFSKAGAFQGQPNDAAPRRSFG